MGGGRCKRPAWVLCAEVQGWVEGHLFTSRWDVRVYVQGGEGGGKKHKTGVWLLACWVVWGKHTLYAGPEEIIYGRDVDGPC